MFLFDTLTRHSRPEQGDRLKSEDRAWDHVEICFVTKTKKKNYPNQYLMWGIWSILADFDPDFCDIFGYILKENLWNWIW